MPPARPNFFIVGAPRCGTTALYTYLRSHPNVFVPKTKEPGFFLIGTELDAFKIAGRTLETYLRLFRRAGTRHRAVGEATPWYLYARGALGRIRDFDAGARIIVMLRPHVAYLHSLHAMLLRNQYEDEPDFEKAWDLQSARRRGVSLPASCRHPLVLQYARVGQLGRQLEAALRIFPRNQVKVILLEDMRRDPGTVYRDVLGFLGLPHDDRRDFPQVNPTRVMRFPALARAYGTYAMPWRLRWVALKGRLGLDDRFKIGAPLLMATSKTAERTPLRGPFRSRILAEFEQDVELLSTLLDRDLRHWTEA